MSAAATGFAALPGWDAAAFQAAARALKAYPPFDTGIALADFEAAFRPEPVGGPTHVTAYYEPVIRARLSPGDGFDVPVLGLPSGEGPWPERGAIAAGALADRAPVLAWLDDPVTLYFLQIQGSGRLALEDGRLLRLGYAGGNGHPYRSIGRIMREEGILGPGGDGLGMRAWLRADRARGLAMMARNPSWVFFAVRGDLDPAEGPVGAMGVPLPARHAVAVDTAHHAYGDLFWLSHPMPDGVVWAGLVMAMDTGAAIRGEARVDLFLGTGDAAGETAAQVNTEGRLIRLRPVDG
ncbi:MAG: MltA domain-containing protein [Pseudomonadota bacterium]